MYLRHGLRRPNAAGVWGVGHGTQNSLFAIAHRILTTATPFCALFPPPAALANVPLSTREPWTYGAKSPRRQSRQAASRTAGTSDRSRQPTGAPRPAAAAAPSPPKPLRGQVDCRCFQQKQAADQGLPSPVPRGKVQEGVPPSWFPAQAGKNLNHFSRRHVRRETFFSRSEVSEVRHPSAVVGHRLSALRALRRGPLAGENRLGDFSQRTISRRRGGRPSGA